MGHTAAPMARPRICIITAAHSLSPTERHGGVTYTSTMVAALRSAGADVEVVWYRDDPGATATTHESGGTLVHEVPLHWVRWLSLLFPNLCEGWQLVSAVQRIERGHPFDVIEGPNNSGICWAFAFRCRSRFWLRMHTSKEHGGSYGTKTVRWRTRFRGWLDGVTARRARHLITHSEYHAATVRREYHLGRRTVAIVPHATAEPPELVDAAANDLAAAIGVLCPRKATDILLEAFARVHASHPVARLLLIGEDQGVSGEGYAPGFQAQHPEAMAAVEFAGIVTDADITERWRSIGFVMLPSRYESFGLVAIEAMARGVPVLATRAGALPEVVGDAGLFVEPDDVAGLASGMIQLLENRELRATLGRRGRERYQRLFAVERMGTECLEVFMRGSRSAG